MTFSSNYGKPRGKKVSAYNVVAKQVFRKPQKHFSAFRPSNQRVQTRAFLSSCNNHSWPLEYDSPQPSAASLLLLSVLMLKLSAPLWTGPPDTHQPPCDVALVVPPGDLQDTKVKSKSPKKNPAVMLIVEFCASTSPRTLGCMFAFLCA